MATSSETRGGSDGMLRLFLLAALLCGKTAATLVSCTSKMGFAAFAYGSSCFEFISNEQTWVGSRDSCHAQGGRLAKVTSANLQNWLMTTASAQFPRKNVWIGLTDRAQAGSFMWDAYDGDVIEIGSYYNWNSGQPWHGYNNDMNCAQMAATSDYSWRLYSCQWFILRVFPSVCEYRLEPTQTTTARVTTTATLLTIATTITQMTTHSKETHTETLKTTHSTETYADTQLATTMAVTSAVSALSQLEVITTSALPTYLLIVIVVGVVAGIVAIFAPLTILLVRRRRRISQPERSDTTLSNRQRDESNLYSKFGLREEVECSSIAHVYVEEDYGYIHPVA